MLSSKYAIAVKTDPTSSWPREGGEFRTTHWSLVLAAGGSDLPKAQAALAKLCEIYWLPVYSFIRRHGNNVEDAKDLTQELFARLLQKQFLQVADREKGRFRSYLLACVQHLLQNEWKKSQTLKRGGQYSFVPLDEAQAEKWYGSEPRDLSPEDLFDRRCALMLLEKALGKLKEEYTAAGKGTLFEALQTFLSGAKHCADSYRDVGQKLNLSENATRQAAHRLRCRLGELIRAQVAQTVTGPAELEKELSHLRRVINNT